MIDDLSAVDLRKRIALCADFTPAERDLILDAINRGGTYLVWSNENAGWWRRGSYGYSRALSVAAHYTHAQALDICRRALPTAAHIGMISEIPVRLADIADVLRVPAVIIKEAWDQ